MPPLCDTLEDLAAWIPRLEKSVLCGLEAVFDDPLDPRSELVGLALAPGPAEARYLPLRGEGGLGEAGLALLRPWLSDHERPKALYAAKDLFSALRARGIVLQCVLGDPQLASFLADPERLSPHRLEAIAEDRLGLRIPSPAALLGPAPGDRAASKLPATALADYATARAEATRALQEPMHRELLALGRADQLSALELPLSWALSAIEATGLRVDIGDLRALERALRARALRAEGATGASQRAAQLITDYTAPLLSAVDARTGRLHLRFTQTGSPGAGIEVLAPRLGATPLFGPRGARLRRSFIADRGFGLISARWLQGEHPGAAELSKRALLAVPQALRAEGLEARVILPLPHGMLLEAPEAELARTGEIVREHMVRATALEPPPRVEVRAGESWAEAQP